MSKKLILVWVLAVITIAVNAQTLLTVKGTVNDSKGAPIPGASVHLLNTNFTTSANNKGAFSINSVPAGTYRVEISAVGYASSGRVINVTSSNTDINVQ